MRSPDQHHDLICHRGCGYSRKSGPSATRGGLNRRTEGLHSTQRRRQLYKDIFSLLRKIVECGALDGDPLSRRALPGIVQVCIYYEKSTARQVRVRSDKDKYFYETYYMHTAHARGANISKIRLPVSPTPSQ